MGREGSRQSGVDKGRARARLYARLGRRRRPRAGVIVHRGTGNPGASRPLWQHVSNFLPRTQVSAEKGASGRRLSRGNQCQALRSCALRKQHETLRASICVLPARTVALRRGGSWRRHPPGASLEEEWGQI